MDYHKIEQYAKGQLTGTALEDFEREMTLDEKLAEEAKFYKEVAMVSKKMKEEEKKDAIREVDAMLAQEGFFEDMNPMDVAEEEFQEQAKVIPISAKRGSKRRWWAYAAGILFFIIGGTLIFSNTNYSNPQLAQQSYQDPGLSSTLKSEQSEALPLSKGVDAYYLQNYETAAQLFSNVPKNSPDYFEAQYYLAHTYYQQKNYDSAIVSYETVIRNTTNPQIGQAAEWYSVLAYLHSEDSARGMDRLHNIAQNPNHRYQVFAKDLEASLASFWRYFTF